MEIEAALLTLDAVREVAVAAHNEARGHARLVAYVALKGAANAAVLRAFLAAKLPRHMIPSSFVFVDTIPRTPGGKIDRKALPAWRPAARDSAPPRDLLETQLADIWEKLLGVVDIHIGDDFFDLGGDSLLAVEMAIRVEQACGVKVALQGMIDALTIEKLAAMLVAGDANNVRAPITRLHAGGSKTPFVFAHGAIASDGFYCRDLARALGPDRPFYVLQPHGLDGRPLPPTIETMADDRLDALRSVQPSGPYVLGGFCAGGAVVFEMARRLRARGERVDVVVLIDTHAANARFRTWSKVVAGVAPALRLSPVQRSDLFRRGRTFLRGLKRASRHGIHEAALFVIKKPYLVLKQANQRESDPPRVLDARPSVWLHYHNALEDYIPERYAGRVVLFRSTHLEHKTPGNFRAGWQHVCDSLAVHEIAGDHRTCVTTHVDELAAKIREALDSAT
jgi:thioesterase domain-containing protein